MIRVLIVDDQALFRGGIRMLVESQPDMTCVGEAADGAQAVRLADEQQPDVVLMDVRMPVLDGISATARIVAARPQSRVVVLTTFDLDEAAARAIRAGASGFILKDAEPELVLASIRKLFKAFGAQRRSAPAAYAELTDRERQIFALAARGLSNTEIARSEFVSEATVKTHISRILAKLALRDRVQLVVYAYEHGLNGERS